MKYLSTLVLLCAACHIHGQNQIQQNNSMNESTIINFGDHTYAIQISGYTSLVVVGSEGVLITDPANTERARLLKAQISKLTSLPVAYIVLSHEHYDHIGGTEVFEAAAIVGHEFMDIFLEMDPSGESPSGLDITFRNHHTINLGQGKTVELYFYAPGDGVTTTVIYEPGQQVVVATDLYVTDAALFHGRATMDDVNLLGARDILNKVLQELKPKHALNGHSPLTDVQYLEDYAQFYNDLYDYCHEWIMSTKNATGSGSIYGKTIDFSKKAQMPAYSHWKHYEELETYVRRMVMSIHHGG